MKLIEIIKQQMNNLGDGVTEQELIEKIKEISPSMDITEIIDSHISKKIKAVENSGHLDFKNGQQKLFTEEELDRATLTADHKYIRLGNTSGNDTLDRIRRRNDNSYHVHQKAIHGERTESPIAIMQVQKNITYQEAVEELGLMEVKLTVVKHR